MPKLMSEFKEAILKLPHNELARLVLRFAKGNQDIFDTLSFEYIQVDTANDLFEIAQSEIESSFIGFSGRIIQKDLAKAISESIAEINKFKKITKDQKLEADLLHTVLKIIFFEYGNKLGTCFTIFDSKVATTLSRFLNLIKKLHPDCLLDYQADCNEFLKIIKKRSGYLDQVYKLPDDVNITVLYALKDEYKMSPTEI